MKLIDLGMRHSKLLIVAFLPLDWPCHSLVYFLLALDIKFAAKRSAYLNPIPAGGVNLPSPCSFFT